MEIDYAKRYKEKPRCKDEYDSIFEANIKLFDENRYLKIDIEVLKNKLEQIKNIIDKGEQEDIIEDISSVLRSVEKLEIKDMNCIKK